MTPEDALAALEAATPLRPSDIPSERGLYLLYDHAGTPRYVGKTFKGLHYRIFRNHCTGDDNSHKWSNVYNAGRLWHTRHAPSSDPADGKIAKELRAAFARRFCRAAPLPLAGISESQLGWLEGAVRTIAPPPLNDWNDIKKLDANEPVDLVDALLTELKWGAEKREAIARQAERWQALLWPHRPAIRAGG